MGRRRGFTPTARGFTLIELLVVIAIIGILAGMLFPVFANAREKARQTACMASIKQLAIAVMMYAEDNDGGYVPATDPAKEDPDTGVWYTLMRWHGRRVTRGPALRSHARPPLGVSALRRTDPVPQSGRRHQCAGAVRVGHGWLWLQRAVRRAAARHRG